MSLFDISVLITEAMSNDIGESLQVLASRTYCRISLVARKTGSECSLYMEVVVRYHVVLSSSETASRRGLVRRLGLLGFNSVQENGSKVYEMRVAEEGVEGALAVLLLDHSSSVVAFPVNDER